MCSIRGDATPQLGAVVAKMLAKRPEERQATMAQVIIDLEKCLGRRGGAVLPLAEAISDSGQSMREALSFLNDAPAAGRGNAETVDYRPPGAAAATAGPHGPGGRSRKKPSLLVAGSAIAAALALVATASIFSWGRRGKNRRIRPIRMGRKPGPMTDDHAARARDGQAWVSTIDGAVVGVLVLLDQPDHLLLDNVAVDPARRGTGVGRDLLRFAEAEAIRRGYPELRLYTHVTMTENIALYARIGYHETGRATQSGFERVFFAKRVAAGAAGR